MKRGDYDLQQRVDRAVMSDVDRRCLYRVAGPCFHPKCLEAHAETLAAKFESEPTGDSDDR